MYRLSKFINIWFYLQPESTEFVFDGNRIKIVKEQNVLFFLARTAVQNLTHLTEKLQISL